MDISRIYRKRFYPTECIELKNDRILFASDELLLTGWKTIHPRSDLASGYSAYLPKQGFKISRFQDTSGSLLYWYCDIITTEPHPGGGTDFVDLLIDIVIHTDGSVKLLDLAEAGEMLAKGIISPMLMAECLTKTEHLLNLIQTGEFSGMQKLINDAADGYLPKSDADLPAAFRCK